MSVPRPAVPRRSPVVLINRFLLKPGCEQEFLARQRAAMHRFAGQVPGLRASRMHRALDGRSAVILSEFENAESCAHWQASAALDAHRQEILPLVEHVEPGLYERVEP